MRNLAVFYFSGTGNTKYIAERIVEKLGAHCRAEVYDVASVGLSAALLSIAAADRVLLAFPIYGGAPPIPMRRFAAAVGERFCGKKIMIAETQYFYSCDGAASLGRTVERFGGEVVLAEHFNMPNNLSDCTFFTVGNERENAKKLARAEKRVDAFCRRALAEKTFRRGFGAVPRALGYWTQRKFWRKGEAEKRKRLSVDGRLCVGCGACVKCCPVKNIRLQNGKAEGTGKCVLCYRCVNLCPKGAIVLLGSAPPKVRYRGPVG